jgi:hypothetical protein
LRPPPKKGGAARCVAALFAFITFGASAPIKRADGTMHRRRGGTFQIFTNIDKPPGSMNGIKLAHAIRGRWPPIKIVTTSGHFSVREKTRDFFWSLASSQVLFG